MRGIPSVGGVSNGLPISYGESRCGDYTPSSGVASRHCLRCLPSKQRAALGNSCRDDRSFPTEQRLLGYIGARWWKRGCWLSVRRGSTSRIVRNRDLGPLDTPAAVLPGNGPVVDPAYARRPGPQVERGGRYMHRLSHQRSESLRTIKGRPVVTTDPVLSRSKNLLHVPYDEESLYNHLLSFEMNRFESGVRKKLVSVSLPSMAAQAAWDDGIESVGPGAPRSHSHSPAVDVPWVRRCIDAPTGTRTKSAGGPVADARTRHSGESEARRVVIGKNGAELGTTFPSSATIASISVPRLPHPSTV